MDSPPRRPLDALRTALRGAPVSGALFGGMVLLQALVAWRLGDATTEAVLVRAGALERGRVQAGEWWRLLTAGLLHVGWLHLAVNLSFGWPVARLVERAVGGRRLLWLFAACAVAGSAASLLAWDRIGAGASGALYGLVGVLLAWEGRALGSLRAFLRSAPVIQVTASIAIITAVTLSARIPMDHAAHAGGLAAGLVAGWLGSAPVPRRAWPAALAWGALAAAAALACWPRPGLSAWTAASLTRDGYDALRRQDLAAVGRSIEALERGGVAGEDVAFLRGFVLEDRGAFDDAEAIFRAQLLGSTSQPRREASRRMLYRIGVRRYLGDVAPKAPQRGYALIALACAAGEAEACRTEQELREGATPPAP